MLTGSASSRTTTTGCRTVCASSSSPPPGSARSIVIGEGITDMTPGSQTGLQMVVTDAVAARAWLNDRSVKTSDVEVLD